MYEHNKERIKAYQKASYEANPEIRRAASRTYARAVAATRPKKKPDRPKKAVSLEKCIPDLVEKKVDSLEDHTTDSEAKKAVIWDNSTSAEKKRAACCGCSKARYSADPELKKEASRAYYVVKKKRTSLAWYDAFTEKLKANLEKYTADLEKQCAASLSYYAADTEKMNVTSLSNNTAYSDKKFASLTSYSDKKSASLTSYSDKKSASLTSYSDKKSASLTACCKKKSSLTNDTAYSVKKKSASGTVYLFWYEEISPSGKLWC